MTPRAFALFIALCLISWLLVIEVTILIFHAVT
jgi:hypothetical protein